MDTKHLPHLPTLALKPSWHNEAGNVDRSACAELRVSAVRIAAGLPEWGWVRAPRGDMSWRRVGTREIPFQAPARNFHGRLAAGIFHIDLVHVEAILDRLLPQRLSGDFRTEKANAMRSPRFRKTPDRSNIPRIPTRFKGKPRSARGPGSEEPLNKYGDRLVASNPNHGATRVKLISLNPQWQQPLRIEKWQRKQNILPFYYLTCPGPMPWWSMPSLHLFPRLAPTSIPRAVRNGSIHFERWQGEADPRCPRLSTIAPGFKARGCPQRVYFLMMPQATREELTDAATAQEWITSLGPHDLHEHHGYIHQLLARYSLLFEPRCFVCRRCLDVRYGEDPEKVRLRVQNHRAKKPKWLPLPKPKESLVS